MGAVVERFGGLVAAQASAHPGRARWLLSSAYRLVGAQMRYIPPKGMSPARSYMQSVTSPMTVLSLIHISSPGPFRRLTASSPPTANCCTPCTP